MARLSVNLNKIALLRNARRTGVPDLSHFARLVHGAGAHGLTVHPRPDERHIRRADVFMLAELMRPWRPGFEFNIEGYPDPEFLALVAQVAPEQCTLVPDAPGVLTSDEGWRLDDAQLPLVQDAAATLHRTGCRVIVFVDPDPSVVPRVRQAGADGIEIYTGGYSAAFRDGQPAALLQACAAAASAAAALRLIVNVGHDLNLDNLPPLVAAVPQIAEASIGHELTADALLIGWEQAVVAYRDALAGLAAAPDRPHNAREKGKRMSRIQRVEFSLFRFEAEGLGLPGHGAAGVGNVVARAGAKFAAQRWAIRIETTDGARGEYVTHWVGTPSSFAQALMLAPHLPGRDPDQREGIWQDLRREVRAYDHMGHGPIDIALWDLFGRRRNVSVARLLGGFREKLPTYASTYHGQDEKGGLDSPAAFAAYARACRDQGFAGFKIHGWHDGDVRREVANVLGVRAAVGDDFPLMLDPASQLRTWADALRVGQACDEANYFWYEDPYRDTGGAVEGHKRLRERLKTPMLVCEHVRGLEAKAAFLIAGGGDIIHADPEYDMGITGAMKIAHLCQSLGLDVQYHACGPAHRAVMAATPNTHFYEMALIGPDMPNIVPPVYTCGYADDFAAVGKDGTVPVPDGPGLGVTYDWDFIERHRVQHHVLTA